MAKGFCPSNWACGGSRARRGVAPAGRLEHDGQKGLFEDAASLIHCTTH